MESYIIKTIACMAAFLFFYQFVLEKENMHTFKRFYLLAALIVSLLIPRVVFTEYVEISSPIISDILTPETNTTILSNNFQKPKEVNKSLILGIIYALGVLLFSIRFCRNIIRIHKRINSNKKVQKGKLYYALLKEDIIPHTFINYIFLNKHKYESKEIPKEVILHEETHAKEYHSLDVIFIEILQIIMWFNPLIYIYNKTIKLNHEFLADSAVLLEDIRTSEYQNTLLSYLSYDSKKKYQPSLANAINYSSIKKRFTIMKKQTSKKSIFLRSLLILPLLALLLFSFSETKIVTKKTNKNINSSSKTITIYINKNQEITLEDEIIEIKSISKRLKQIINTNSQKEVSIEAEGNLNIKLFESIEKQIKKAGGILIMVTADVIKIMDSNKPRGINFTARDTMQIKQENGEFILGYTTDNKQEGVSRKLMSEYNTLSKKYNTMLSKDKNILIKMKDVNRLEYVRSLMSDKQKIDAEPLPNFPPIPEPPTAPEIKEGETSSIPLTPSPNTKSNLNKWTVTTGANRNTRVENEDIPPTLPTIALHINKKGYSKELNLSIDKYLQKNKTFESAIENYSKKGIGSHHKLWDSYNEAMKLYVNYYNLAIEEGKLVKPNRQSPPIPPTPPTPLDHVIKMAKKGADFYYEGNKISSDKAIEILKQNKDLNIDSRSSESGKSTVRITREPIKID